MKLFADNLYDTSCNRRVTPLEVEKCRQLVADIKSVVSMSKLASSEKNWKSPNGESVYGEILKCTWDITADFLERLRMESFVFSGWHLSNVITKKEVVPSWTDALGAHFSTHSNKDWSISAFRYYTQSLPDEYICDPPLVAGEVGYRVGRYCVNRDTVAYQERMTVLLHLGLLERLKSRERPVIVEIGGGYGALAYFIKRVVPHARYFIIDLPQSLMFSGCYLTLAQNRFPIVVYNGGDIPPLPEPYILVPDSLAKQLDPDAIDLAINTMSFAEMPRSTVAEYADFIARHLDDEGALFEQNFDNSHYRKDTFCAPREAIAPFFQDSFHLTGKFLWGAPTVWKHKAAIRYSAANSDTRSL